MPEPRIRIMTHNSSPQETNTKPEENPTPQPRTSLKESIDNVIKSLSNFNLFDFKNLKENIIKIKESLQALFSSIQGQLSDLNRDILKNNPAAKTIGAIASTTGVVTTTKDIDTKIRNKGAVPASYATNKPLGETVKLFEKLDFTESQGLARKVFGNGPATDLLIKLDGGSGTTIKRMIALGQHEGGLQFGRQNPDPRSGFNIGTFQIGGMRTSKADSLNKYKQCYEAGVKLAKEHGIEAAPYHLASKSQRDLLVHLGYIQSQRGGDATFDKLRNPNLSDKQVITLMHRTIQGGIRAIGESVVRQIANNRIDVSDLA